MIPHEIIKKIRQIELRANRLAWAGAFLCLAGILSGSIARADEGKAVTVRVVNLHIVSSNYGTNFFNFDHNGSLAVGLLVESATTPLITIDSNRSFMERVTDDTGTAMPLGHFLMDPRISTNGHAAVVSFSTPAAPGRGAKVISAAGKLELVFGLAEESFEFTNTSLVVQSLPLPQQQFGITRVTNVNGILGINYKAGAVPVKNVKFHMEGDAGRWVKSIILLDKDGNIIADHYNDSFRSGSYSEWGLNIPREVNAATVRMILWTKHEEQLIPFSFTNGVGL